MRIFSILLSFCFTLNVFASTTSNLEKIIDNHQYSLTVEWDQKDKEFLKKQNERFVSQLVELRKSSGLTEESILTLAEKRLPSTKAFEAFKLKLALYQDDLSGENVSTLVENLSKEIYAKGASWNGDVGTYVVYGALILAVAYVIWHSTNYECSEYENRYSCEDTEYCSYYQGAVCVEWTIHTNCGYENVCVDYVKK